MSIYVENPFSLKGKITRQTLNQFHYSQINYNISCVYLMAKKKNLSYFSLLSHTLIIYLEGDNALLSPL